MRGPHRIQALNFIPDSADFNDPAWAGRLQELANAMVMYDAKSVLIQRFTGLSYKDIVARYKSLCGDKAPSSGRLRHIQAARFVTRFDRSTNDFVLQSAAFAQCLSRIEDAFREPVNRGWLLVVAYRTYERVTERLVRELKLTRLDINTCYELMVHFGNKRFRQHAEIRQKHCSHCGTQYLILSQSEEEAHYCPMCAIEQYYARLGKIGRERIESLKAQGALATG